MGHDFEPLSARIIEAAIAVHKALGPGFLESITKTRKYENTKNALIQAMQPAPIESAQRTQDEAVQVGASWNSHLGTEAN
jgi:hypothetical protein